jgi:hypothetical protein
MPNLPSKTADRPSVASPIVSASKSLERYEAGDLPGDLACLEAVQAHPLPELPAWLATESAADRRAKFLYLVRGLTEKQRSDLLRWLVRTATANIESNAGAGV